MALSDRLRPQPRILVAIAVLILLLIGAGLWMNLARAPVPPAPVALTIALPVQVAATALFVAQDRHLFPKHGLAVTLRPFLLGKQALQTVLDGQSDLAIVADTPFALAVLRGAPIAALATVFESRHTMAIFARKDSGITDAASLAGKKVGTVVGTNAEYFLDTMFDVHGIERNASSVVALKPEQLVHALTDSKVDAVTVWNPDLARLEQDFGERGVTIYGEDFFVYRFLIVGKKSFIDSHPVQVGRILAAIEESNALIKAEPEPTRTLLGLRLGMAPVLLARSFDPNDFTLGLDQSLLLALSDQTRWAESKQMVPSKSVPDFRDFVRAAPLTALAPEANKIIR